LWAGEGKEEEVFMHLSERALAVVAAVLWGGCMLFVSLVNAAVPTYGMEFLKMMSSVYPGFHATRTFGDVLIATIYGLVDGAVGGYLLGLLYNQFVGPVPHESLVSGEARHAA
jgi:hypothetical protein